MTLQGGAGSAVSALAQAQAQQQQQPRKKQRKSSSPDALLTAEVRQAAKHNDPLAGLAAYDKAKAEGKPFVSDDPEGQVMTSHILAQDGMGTS